MIDLEQLLKYLRVRKLVLSSDAYLHERNDPEFWRLWTDVVLGRG